MGNPGWYQDPAGGGGQRYWDGAQWRSAQPPPLGGASSSRRKTMWTAAIVAVVAAVGVVSMLLDAAHKDEPKAEKTATPTAREMPASSPAASTTDATFIKVLQDEGIPISNPERFILGAKAMCFSLRAGQLPASVVSEISDEFGMTANQAAFFFGAGTYGYCPDQNPHS